MIFSSLLWRHVDSSIYSIVSEELLFSIFRAEIGDSEEQRYHPPNLKSHEDVGFFSFSSAVSPFVY
jgi:hypothetical protein